MKSWLMCSFVVSGIHVNIHWQPVDLYLRNIYFLLVGLLILGRLTAKARVAPITVACNNNSSHERQTNTPGTNCRRIARKSIRPKAFARTLVDSPNDIQHSTTW